MSVDCVHSVSGNLGRRLRELWPHFILALLRQITHAQINDSSQSDHRRRPINLCHNERWVPVLVVLVSLPEAQVVVACTGRIFKPNELRGFIAEAIDALSTADHSPVQFDLVRFKDGTSIVSALASLSEAKQLDLWLSGLNGGNQQSNIAVDMAVDLTAAKKLDLSLISKYASDVDVFWALSFAIILPNTATEREFGRLLIVVHLDMKDECVDSRQVLTTVEGDAIFNERISEGNAVSQVTLIA